jgi:hypothetical protein
VGIGNVPIFLSRGLIRFFRLIRTQWMFICTLRPPNLRIAAARVGVKEGGLMARMGYGVYFVH